ncbi:MAG: hypothetical protein IPO43_07180 [Rhodoferax sp.]|nr:hypothetical protein [Rhodoferax sp.]
MDLHHQGVLRVEAAPVAGGGLFDDFSLTALWRMLSQGHRAASQCHDRGGQGG